MTVPLVDIGVNLMHRSFHTDREEAVRRAAEAGVTRMIITGTSVRSSEEAAAYAGGQPTGTLYSTAGVHPHDAKMCNPGTISRLRRLAAQPQVVAIGECGLDYNRDFSPRDVQRTWFDAQVKLACELRLPLFLHEREAFSDFVQILQSYGKELPPSVVHCFTGTGAELDAYVNMGLYIGVTGWICDERRGRHLRELVRRIPADRLLVETDAPFLTPRDLRPKPAGSRNEPLYLPHIVRTIAECTGRPFEEIAAQTTQNAVRLFGLA
ncbi:TatD family hydrolase [Paenibacillus sp. GCM10012303]|uniref:TatD family hydrolase n=1 Tax=Paenibacillus sp. GCM10012303 TaxID=3317340 RepID=UPI0036208F00